jgi:hypothetical protein
MPYQPATLRSCPMPPDEHGVVRRSLRTVPASVLMSDEVAEFVCGPACVSPVADGDTGSPQGGGVT